MERFRSFRAQAVVLRHADWGEADRLLTLYTLEQGKVRAIAKGVRKAHSRKAGHLEPFMHVNLLLARGRDLLIVTQAETLDAYLPLREDLLLTGYACYVVELLDRFTYEEESPISGLYRLLVKTLERLCKARTDPRLAVRYFEVRLLDYLGFRPQLFACAICGGEIQPEDQFFSPAQGGVICPRCAEKAQAARPVSMDALRYLRFFQRNRYEDARNARPTPAVHAELESLMQYYVTYLLERRLNSPEFLRRVRGGK